jgi:RNA polymerase sigma factor (sigma-70 family)
LNAKDDEREITRMSRIVDNRLMIFRHQPGVPCRIDDKLVHRKIDDRHGQYANDHAVEPARRGATRGSVVIDLPFPLEALWRQLEQPRDDHDRHEADDHENDDEPGGALANAEQRRERIQHLHDKPRERDVSHGCADHIPAAQFRYQRHGPYPSAISSSRHARRTRKIARNLVQSRPMAIQSEKKPTVFIVDDDAAIRFAMQALMDSVNLDHEIFESGDEFLEKITEQRPGCLVLDIRMPGLGGLELQEELIKRGNTLPIIFITGHGDVPMAVEAMQKGAVDFIQKPFRDQELLDRIREALATDEERREEQQQQAAVIERLDRLTNREREVFDLVVTGKPNKVIAYELGVSQRTVEIHRARVMEKMQARSLADLVKMHMTA